MKVLVTGAAGFIGSYLCQRLLAAGHQVTAAARQVARLKHSHLGCNLAEVDLLTPRAWLDLAPHDRIVHLACANEMASRDPWCSLELSLKGTQALVELAKQWPGCGFLHISTFQVYGCPPPELVDEDTPPCPVNSYGLNHWFAEQALEMLTRKTSLNTTVLRPTNVYGPFVAPSVNRWSLVPGCFCQELFETGCLTLHSSGLQVRNFLSLEELSQVVLALLRKAPAGHQVFNVSSPHYLSIQQVAHLVCELYRRRYQRTAEVVVAGLEPCHPQQFIVSRRKLESIGACQEAPLLLVDAINSLYQTLEERKIEIAGTKACPLIP